MSNTLKFGAGKWAAKAGSVLAYNSENDNFKPLPFTFTRASSATRVNESGLIESVASGVPRIDFLDNADGHLLLEPSRSNIYVYSSEINSTRWTSSSGGTGSAPVMNSSTELAKDGSLTACEWVFDTGSGTTTSDQSNIFYSSITTVVGVTYSFSVWVYSSLSDVEIQLRGAGTVYEKFTLNSGWNRIVRVAEASSTSTLPVIGLRQSVNGTVNSSVTVKLWGAQLELGSYATSYIPTSGSSVTRAAETCNNAGNTQVINSTEGVLYTEISALADDLTFRLISLSDGTTNNRLSLGYRTTSNAIYCEIRNATVTQAFLLGTVDDINNYSKVAVKYKQDDFALWINGIEVSTDNSGLTPPNLSQLNLDSGQKNSSFFYGRIKSVQVYNQALTDSQLAALTS